MSTSDRPVCWVPGATDSGHDVDHLPYAVFAPAPAAPAEAAGSDAPWRVGVRIGDQVLDLAAAARATAPAWTDLVATDALNPLMAAGREVWTAVRAWVVGLLTDPAAQAVVGPALSPVATARLRLPFAVADYVDYYASEHHATNVGRIFRPDGDALTPNWKHLPVAYHGRAGSVVVSGTDVHRPCGQRRAPTEPLPSYGPCERLDLEAELGFVVGRSLPLGQRAATSDLESCVFGVTGVNDWSARDIQAWEYVPLGPNLGKSFATSIGAWVTPLAALEHARVPLPTQEPVVLPYLREPDRHGYDIAVEVEVNGSVVARPPYASMYWSPGQMLAHLTVNGASLRVGDLFASGTISGPEPDQVGSLLELSWGGSRPWTAGGEPRTFLEDGDEVVLRYSAPRAPGRPGRIAMGEVRGRVLPAV